MFDGDIGIYVSLGLGLVVFITKLVKNGFQRDIRNAVTQSQEAYAAMIRAKADGRLTPEEIDDITKELGDALEAIGKVASKSAGIYGQIKKLIKR